MQSSWESERGFESTVMDRETIRKVGDVGTIGTVGKVQQLDRLEHSSIVTGDEDILRRTIDD